MLFSQLLSHGARLVQFTFLFPCSLPVTCRVRLMLCTFSYSLEFVPCKCQPGIGTLVKNIMASGNYKVVLQNEKSMNDAVLSVFSNLHKAARKKNDYIWSTYKFDFLNSIWDDDIEPKTNKMYGEFNRIKEDSKNCWTVKHQNVDIKAKSIGMHCKQNTEKLRSNMEWKGCGGNSQDMQKTHQTAKNSPCDSDVKIHQQSHNVMNTPCNFSCNQINSEFRSESANSMENKSKLNDDTIHMMINDISSHVKLNFSTENCYGMYKAKDARESMTENFNVYAEEESNSEQTFMKYPQQRNLPAKPKRLNLSKDSISSGDDDDVMKKSSSSSKTRCIQKASKSQLKIKSAQNEQKTLRSKRSRHDSDSSTGSPKPLQKKVPERTENMNESSENPEKNFFKAMLSVKIIKDDQFHEFIVSISEFNRLKKKFPKLSEVFPGTDGGEKEIHYCVDAVKAVFGYLFHPPYNFNAMPDGRVAIEVLAATKSWDIHPFHKSFQSHLLKKITENNFRAIYPFASHFGLFEICDVCKTFIPDGGSLNDNKPYRSRKCSLVVSQYVEPLEYCIPLRTAEQMLNDNFDRDIRNTIIFEAITKNFSITGFQIILDTDDSNSNEISATLDIFYSIKIVNSSAETEEIKLSKPFRSNIVIYFKRKIVVKQHQKMQISVETTIKPYLCFETLENFIKKESAEAEFSLTLESTYRVKNSGGKRFIIGKLLYNPTDPVD